MNHPSVPKPAVREILSRDLTHLNYRRFHPHPRLQAWVQCYWSVCLPCAPEYHYRERMYPDGGVSITLNFSDVDRHWISAKQSLHSLTIKGPIDSLGIRFNPAGAQWLLRQPLNEMSADRYRLSDFAFSGIELLVERLCRTDSPLRRVTLVDQWLLQQWLSLQPAINLAQRVAQHWPASGIDFNDWCQLQGLNRRTVERAFQFYLGMAPGKFKTLQQVKAARELIKVNPAASLTTVAQASGYYDQSHFIHQFRKITGQTPGEYRRRQQRKLEPIC